MELDWSQPASLERVNSLSGEIGRPWRRGTAVIDQGTLVEMADRYDQLPQRNRGSCRLVISHGFHLDGIEIEDLISQRGK